jgi:hypothetical protein
MYGEKRSLKNTHNIIHCNFVWLDFGIHNITLFNLLWLMYWKLCIYIFQDLQNIKIIATKLKSKNLPKRSKTTIGGSKWKYSGIPLAGGSIQYGKGLIGSFWR